MLDNEKDLKFLSKEELDDLLKDTIEMPNEDRISYACGCLSSAWDYVSPAK